MHNQFSIGHPGLADTQICKILQNNRDIVVSIELTAIKQVIDNVEINEALNNDDYHFR
jgi:hypothetical protein